MKPQVTDPRVKLYEYWHKAVFDDQTRDRIPHDALRDYLDYLWELGRANKGAMPYLPNMTICDIKQRGAQLYKEEKDRT